MMKKGLKNPALVLQGFPQTIFLSGMGIAKTMRLLSAT